jgi:DNA primase
LTTSELKEQIIEDNKLIDILNALGMRHIKQSSVYISCGMPDGDNPKSTIIYRDSLHVDAHTRNIVDSYGNSDIFSLILFIRNDLFFTSMLRWVCEICGYDFYGEVEERPSILNIFNEIFEMRSNDSHTEEILYSKPIDEYLLSYFQPLNSKLFFDDGISFKVQRLFDIRYDGYDNRILIPIRDEQGILVGIKGRLNYKELMSFENKYMYLTECNKSSILFGLYLAYESIKKEGIVYVAESEKGVMQAFSNGIYNIVAIGGKQLSRAQVKKLTYLGVEVCLCYDDKADIGTDGEIDNKFYDKQKKMFIDGVKLSHIVDKKNKILGHKESPFDNMDMWEELLKLKKDI